jgi:hypothetical protein
MPPLLLARHLTIKALRREEEKPEWRAVTHPSSKRGRKTKKPRHAGGVDVMQIVCLLALLATAREAQGGEPDAGGERRWLGTVGTPFSA